MKTTDDELRAIHDELDSDRAAELDQFKASTKTHMAFVAAYKSAKQALPRRPKDPEPGDKVTA